MSGLSITTDRMELIAATTDMVEAEVAGRSRLAELLGAEVPEGWPPPLNDADTAAFTLDQLRLGPEQVGWWRWYFLLHPGGAAGRILVGCGGFKGRPDPDGTVEVSYSLLPEYQGQGHATEAIRGLLGWVFGEAGVRCVVAETLPDLAPSIRVLERCGFVPMERGAGEGVLRFGLPRGTWETA
jgi:RimJ/RimL family protein N-acetyltransferase